MSNKKNVEEQREWNDLCILLSEVAEVSRSGPVVAIIYKGNSQAYSRTFDDAEDAEQLYDHIKNGLTGNCSRHSWPKETAAYITKK